MDMKEAKQNKSQKSSHRLALFILLAPAVILVSIFILYPVFNTLFFSVYKWNGLGPLTNFKGAGNFIMMFEDEVFRTAFANNLLVVVFSLLVQLPISLLLAIYLSKRTNKSIIMFRTIYFLPFIFSEIITGVIWRFIYDPIAGLLRYVQPILFPGTEYEGYLSNPDTVFYAILFVIFWKYFGFHMIIYLAGLQGIPEEYYEAAKIDGANRLQQAWHITLPLLRPALRISIFFCVVGSFQIFDVIWAMSQGGPVHSSETLVTYMYQYGFKRFQLGYGSAVAIVVFTICLVFNLIYQRVMKENLQ